VRVLVTLTHRDGEEETVLMGDAPVFDVRDYKKGVDKRLMNIGFWLTDWHFDGHMGPRSQKGVFIPWSSALYVRELD